MIVFYNNVVRRATTHTDLVVRAKQMGVDVMVVHNASVMNAVGLCGLQLYRYGETVSIPFFTETWRPDSFYEKIKRNRDLGLHTLCLLGEVVCHFSSLSFFKCDCLLIFMLLYFLYVFIKFGIFLFIFPCYVIM